MVTGLGHSTTFEKSSPYLHQGMFSTHMVPDLARWPNSLGGKLLFGASERPLNHPGADLDDPIVLELEDGAHSDGQILPFCVKLWILIVPMFKGLSEAPKSSLPPSEFGHLARSGTIWVKNVPWCKYGELFSEVVLWPRPVIILAPQGPETALDDSHFPS